MVDFIFWREEVTEEGEERSHWIRVTLGWGREERAASREERERPRRIIFDTFREEKEDAKACPMPFREGPVIRTVEVS